MLLNWRKYSILGLLVLMIMLTGCSTGTAHVTVNSSGSVDLAVQMKVNTRAEALISQSMEDTLISKLKEQGIQLEKSQDGKSTIYQFLKSYASFEDMSALSGGLDIVDVKVDTQDHWLYTKYNVEAEPKLNSYIDTIMDNIGNFSLSKPIARAILQNLAFDFKLTLPMDLYGDTNAAVDEGRTRTWKVTLADTEPIKLQVYVPNVMNIVIVCILLLIVVSTAIILFIRKRKLRR